MGRFCNDRLFGGRFSEDRASNPPDDLRHSVAEGAARHSRGFRLQAEVPDAAIFRLKPEATSSF